MSQEIDGIFLQAVFSEQIISCLSLQIEIIPGLFVVKIYTSYILVQSNDSLLFEETHQWRLQGLHIAGWYFAHRHLGS